MYRTAKELENHIVHECVDTDRLRKTINNLYKLPERIQRLISNDLKTKDFMEIIEDLPYTMAGFNAVCKRLVFEFDDDETTQEIVKSVIKRFAKLDHDFIMSYENSMFMYYMLHNAHRFQELADLYLDYIDTKGLTLKFGDMREIPNFNDKAKARKCLHPDYFNHNVSEAFEFSKEELLAKIKDGYTQFAGGLSLKDLMDYSRKIPTTEANGLIRKWFDYGNPDLYLKDGCPLTDEIIKEHIMSYNTTAESNLFKTKNFDLKVFERVHLKFPRGLITLLSSSKWTNEVNKKVLIETLDKALELNNQNKLFLNYYVNSHIGVPAKKFLQRLDYPEIVKYAPLYNEEAILEINRTRSIQEITIAVSKFNLPDLIHVLNQLPLSHQRYYITEHLLDYVKMDWSIIESTKLFNFLRRVEVIDVVPNFKNHKECSNTIALEEFKESNKFDYSNASNMVFKTVYLDSDLTPHEEILCFSCLGYYQHQKGVTFIKIERYYDKGCHCQDLKPEIETNGELPELNFPKVG